MFYSEGDEIIVCDYRLCIFKPVAHTGYCFVVCNKTSDIHVCNFDSGFLVVRSDNMPLDTELFIIEIEK